MAYKDLMIGDWVKEIAIDDSILTGSAEVQIDLAGLRLCAEGMVKLEPIPLTEEILKANGFTDKQYTFYDGYNFELHNGAKDSVSVGALWYVHELQHALRLCGLNELADNFKLH